MSGMNRDGGFEHVPVPAGARRRLLAGGRKGRETKQAPISLQFVRLSRLKLGSSVQRKEPEMKRIIALGSFLRLASRECGLHWRCSW
jgi:hypothetical protein